MWMQVSFDKASAIRRTGFIAQEVEQAAKDAGYDFSGYAAPKNQWGLYTISYEQFVVPLVKAVQELSAKNDALQQQNNDLAQRVAKLEAMMHVPQSAAAISFASLDQNIPNPFTNSTTIGYSLPGKFSSAQMIITDKNGKQLKQINVSGPGKGTISVDASILASGAYSYSLYVDGKLIATKQMVLFK